nr:perisilin-like protein [Euplectella curvistellata]
MMKFAILFVFVIILSMEQVHSTFSIKDQLIKTILVRAHNQLRREVQPSASNMKELEWSQSLQTLADYKIQDCQSSSLNLNYNDVTYGYATQVIYGLNHPNLTTFLTTVESWFESSQYYSLYDNECRSNPRVCENYIQAAWANSSEIGCAYNYCSFATDQTSRNGVLILCLYYSSMDGDLPYIPGEKCSLCPVNEPYCNHGLCSRISATVSPHYTIPYYSYGNSVLYTPTSVLLLLFIIILSC